MTIEVLPVILLPTLDAERFQRCLFSLENGEAVLTINMRALPGCIIHFQKLRWHRFTPEADCTAAITAGCYFAVAEVRESPALRAHIAREKIPPREARLLHHYRIFLGRGGCHEAFAEAVVVA
jgi:hypothetical protein